MECPIDPLIIFVGILCIMYLILGFILVLLANIGVNLVTNLSKKLKS